jgi:hypothetical protein
MRRKHNRHELRPQVTEESYFRDYLEQIVGPTEPRIKIYKILPNGKQVCVHCIFVEEYSSSKGVYRFPPADRLPEIIRDQFGPGRYLLRTVYSNGRFGPSRVMHIG